MAVQFGGSASYTVTGTANVPGTAFTISLWLYITTPPVNGDWSSLIYQDTGGSSPQRSYFEVAGWNQRVDINGLSGEVAHSKTLSTNTWYRVAVVVADGQGRLFVANAAGPLGNPTVDTLVMPTGRTFMAIAASDGGTAERLRGRLANLKIWNEALTDVQVEAELGTYNVLNTTNLLRAHKFLTATNVKDSGTGANLTTLGTPTTAAGPVELDTTPVTASTGYGETTIEGLPITVLHQATPVDVTVEGPPATVTRNVSAPVGETSVEGLDVTVTIIPTVRVYLDVPGDTAVEGPELVTHHISYLGGPGEVAVEGLDVQVAHVTYLGRGDITIDGLPAVAAGTNIPPIDIVVEGLAVQVSYGGQDSASRRGLRPLISLPTTRVIAQSVLTGRWLHWELPVQNLEITWSLSGPTVITGEFTPEILDLTDVGLEAYGTWIHVEDSGQIRASGILQPTSVNGETLSLEALGPSWYAGKIPYRGQYSQIQVDPADIVRALWAHIQSHPRGNLGVQVHGSTSVKLGTEPAEKVEFDATDPESGEVEQVAFEAGGPYKLDYWENTLCGKEIDDLAKETPFDYLERAQWNNDKTAVEHHIDLLYPRAGQRLAEARFAQGENIIESSPIEEPDDIYADQIYVQGKGEGETAVVGYAGTTVGTRLRLPAVVQDKTIETADRARAVASENLAARLAALVEITEIAVDARHPNALLGSFGPGDEIYPQVTLPYVGDFAAWHRVTAVRYLAAREAAVLTLTRRGEFSDR